MPAFSIADENNKGDAGHTIQRGAQTFRLVHHDLSPALRNIPPIPILLSPKRISYVKPLPLPQPDANRPVSGEPDPGLQTFSGPIAMPAPIKNWEGVGAGFSGPQGTYVVNFAPPDTNGDVGPNHYVQTVNVAFAVWNKTGTVLYGPVNINTLWSGFGGGCQNNNDGDPTVTYDQFNDRWVITQFSISNTPYLECVAVSQTGDPTGAYYRYAYSYATVFNDYPKLGVWNGDYYITYNMFNNGLAFVGGKVCAFQGSKLRAGLANTMQCFNESSGGLLPADIDGSTNPPGGAPEHVISFGFNSLRIWKMQVDWNNAANSTFTGPATLAVNAFTPACNGGTCITQPGTPQQLDSLADRLMYRLAYRNRSGTESFLLTHSVAASGISSIRWYELRTSNSATTTPTVHQQGTYSPDTNHRWMGSIAMDSAGNIAAGYSVASSANNLKPSIRFAGRLSSDPLGQFSQGETTLFTGTGVQTTNLSRWGDYSSMNLDPTDDCTFWYTTEYLTANGTFNWHTRIGAFKFPGCGGPDTTSPVTSITAPPNGIAVRGSIPVSAIASDNVGVTKVEFYADSTLIGSDTIAPYSVNWNTNAFSNGGYSLTTKAFDGADNTGTSSGVNVTVDNTPPTTAITSPSQGTMLSGNATINANASDNAGVTNVEFYAGGNFIGMDSTAPYSIVWNTTFFGNGAYNLTSKAFDAAGNSGTSSAVPITISNATACANSQLLMNPGFESGNVSWNPKPSTGIIAAGTINEPARTGTRRARLGGKGTANTSALFQQVLVPANACDATFSFWMRIVSLESTSTLQNDKLQIQVWNTNNTLLKTLGTNSNLKKGITYVKYNFDVLQFKGQTIRIRFFATENASLKTSFLIDDTALSVISNGLATCSTSQIFLNSGFEHGNVSWTSNPANGVIGTETPGDPARSGNWRAKLGGKGTANTSAIHQQVAIPSTACTAKLAFYERITTTETTTTVPNDKLHVQALTPSGTLLTNLASYSNLNKSAGYLLRTFNLISFKGRTIRIRFMAVENSSFKTTFLVDDTALKIGQ